MSMDWRGGNHIVPADYRDDHLPEREDEVEPTDEELRIITSDQGCGWVAHRTDYDGAPDSHCPIGRGRTEQAAIADLLECESMRDGPVTSMHEPGYWDAKYDELADECKRGGC